MSDEPTGVHALPPWATRPTPAYCAWCRRAPRPDERHLVLVGTSGPDDSPEPEYVCLGPDDEPLPMGDEPASYGQGTTADPWQAQGPMPPPPF